MLKKKTKQISVRSGIEWKTDDDSMRWNEEMKFSLFPAPQVFEKVSHFDCVFPYIKQGLGVLGHAPVARPHNHSTTRSLWSAGWLWGIRLLHVHLSPCQWCWMARPLSGLGSRTRGEVIFNSWSQVFLSRACIPLLCFCWLVRFIWFKFVDPRFILLPRLKLISSFIISNWCHPFQNKTKNKKFLRFSALRHLPKVP